MTRIYLLLVAALLCPPTTAPAQIVLSAANSIPGTGLAYCEYESDSFFSGGAGTAQTWDFTGVSFDTASYCSKVVLCSTTPGCALYTGANLAFQAGDSDYFYYQASAGGLMMLGRRIQDLGVDIVYDTVARVMKYPLAYNDTFSTRGSYHYAVPVPGGIKTYYAHDQGSAVADGWGTLKTPAGTFSGVLRVHQYNYTVYRIEEAGNSTQFATNTETCTWYDTVHRAQLAESYKITSTAAPGPTTYSYYTRFPGTSTGLSGNAPAGGSVTVAPNPAASSIGIQFTLTEMGEVTADLYDLTGRKVQSSRQLLAGGPHSLVLDVSQLADGLYTLHLSAGSQSVVRKTVIRH